MCVTAQYLHQCGHPIPNNWHEQCSTAARFGRCSGAAGREVVYRKRPESGLCRRCKEKTRAEVTEKKTKAVEDLKAKLREELKKELMDELKVELKMEVKKEMKEERARRKALQKEEADLASVGLTRIDMNSEKYYLKKRQKMEDFQVALKAGLVSVDLANRAGRYHDQHSEAFLARFDCKAPPDSLRVSTTHLSVKRQARDFEYY